MKLTLKQLQVFITVARSQSLTQASGLLFMTKGAVSQTIAEIEHRLAVPLFDRHHARLFLNSEGRRLVPVADELLQRMSEVDRMFDDSVLVSDFTFGCTKTIGSYLLPGLLSGFKQQQGWMPGVSIANSSEVRQKLLHFEYDMALVEGVMADQDLVTTPWRQDEMVIIAAKDHPLARAEPVSMSALRDCAWILREAGSGSRHQFETYLAPLLSQPKVTLSLETFDAILLCVHRQLGLTFASKLIIEHPFFAGHFSVIRTWQRFYRVLSLCHHHNKYLSAGARQWMAFLQSAA
ncbi:LysR substrate-binding domain-containing protein [Biostraticola tofi]|uniref:DNA-binding transcriptional LysR family regulator n=1 Tax=Biostraticola tofi TaxID=466109 RepID=A0A4R3Z3H7_9GAMM|nr:LysR substrate-binding domain-containing protein [Biostraticola tofi]TCV99827.1 DNA-binding transcriptional LysR family regulator [Biostraticola tofi]